MPGFGSLLGAELVAATNGDLTTFKTADRLAGIAGASTSCGPCNETPKHLSNSQPGTLPLPPLTHRAGGRPRQTSGRMPGPRLPASPWRLEGRMPLPCRSPRSARI